MRATRNIRKIEEVLLLWTPSSWVETFHSSLKRATYGRSWGMSEKYFPRPDTCHICGRKENYFFDFVTLIAIFDEKREEIKFICTDHGPDTVWECFRGEEIVLPPLPSLLMRRARNVYQWIVLNGYISIRFMRFFLFDACLYQLGGYKIAAWYFFLRGLKR